jgi:hypothetical protein
MNNKEMKRNFRGIVTQVIENNGGNCSVCNQQIDTGLLSFANMRNIKTSWGRKALSLFVPKEITFVIPYAEIKGFTVSPGRKQIDAELEGRNLLSIRGLQ